MNVVSFIVAVLSLLPPAVAVAVVVASFIGAIALLEYLYVTLEALAVVVNWYIPPSEFFIGLVGFSTAPLTVASTISVTFSPGNAKVETSTVVLEAVIGTVFVPEDISAMNFR